MICNLATLLLLQRPGAARIDVLDLIGKVPANFERSLGKETKPSQRGLGADVDRFYPIDSQTDLIGRFVYGRARKIYIRFRNDVGWRKAYEVSGLTRYFGKLPQGALTLTYFTYSQRHRGKFTEHLGEPSREKGVQPTQAVLSWAWTERLPQPPLRWFGGWPANSRCTYYCPAYYWSPERSDGFHGHFVLQLY